MAILGLQGIRGGVGTTSITAALAWALQLLGETVLAIDASPDNMLRYFFNVDATHRDGWARALIDGGDWRDAGIRYTSHIDILPFGLLSPGERENVDKLYPLLESFVGMVEKLEQQGDHRWLLLVIPR
ncbi:cell division protein [Raoultella planticola]|nr:cell division protein [Raoultella planticola]